MTRALIIGGAGRTGRRLARRLTDRGERVIIASRHPGDSGARLDLSAAHPQDAIFDEAEDFVVSVEPPIDPAGAEKLLHLGVRAVADAAASRGARLIVISQIYVTRPEALAGMEAITKARWRGEQAVRTSGADYAIVRPGWLHDGQANGSRIEQGDRGEGRTSRDSVADVCLELLTAPQLGRVTFEIFDDAAAGDRTLEIDGAETGPAIR